MGQSHSEPLPNFEGISQEHFPKPEGSKHTLKDGREMGFMEYGKIGNGKYPIILIPGVPGSRFFVRKDRKILEDLDIRLVVIERPGFGLSTPNPKGTLLSFADDVTEIADSLNIQKFGIVGYSAGGPFTLACCYKLGDRILSAAIISSLAPRDVGTHYTQNMPLMFKVGWWAAKNSPSFVHAVFKSNYSGYLANPVKKGREEWKVHDEIDFQDYTKNNEIEELFLFSALELSSRQQYGTESHEHYLFSHDWGFKLSDIKVPHLIIYHGKKDRGCTIQMGEYIHSQIPQSVAKFVDEKGHMLYFFIWDEALKGVVDGFNSESKGKEEIQQGKEEK